VQQAVTMGSADVAAVAARSLAQNVPEGVDSLPSAVASLAPVLDRAGILPPRSRGTRDRASGGRSGAGTDDPLRIHAPTIPGCTTERATGLQRRGDRLDPTAAKVIVALGGSEPAWYSVAYALVTAYEAFPERGIVGVNACAAALALAEAERAQLARTVEDQEVLRGLGAYGEIYVGANPCCDQTSWALVVNHRDPDVMKRAYTSLKFFRRCSRRIG